MARSLRNSARGLLWSVLVIIGLAGCLASHHLDGFSHLSRPPAATTARSPVHVQPARQKQAQLSATRTPRPSAPVVPGANALAPAKTGSPALAPATPARLVLSASAGPVGTTVFLAATGCPPPDGGYRAFFADSRALGDPQIPAYRHLFAVTATGAGDARGQYQIGRGDNAGFGLFEIPCGAATNALAGFTVTGT